MTVGILLLGPADSQAAGWRLAGVEPASWGAGRARGWGAGRTGCGGTGALWGWRRGRLVAPAGLSFRPRVCALSDECGDERGGGAEECRRKAPGDLGELALRGCEFGAQGAVFLGEAVDGGGQYGDLDGYALQFGGQVLDGGAESGDAGGDRLERGGQVVQTGVTPRCDWLSHFTAPSRYFSREEHCSVRSLTGVGLAVVVGRCRWRADARRGDVGRGSGWSFSNRWRRAARRRARGAERGEGW